MRASLPRQTYLWTLFRPHVEPAMGFGNLKEFAEWLDGQNLPAIAPSAWIEEVGQVKGEISRWAYVHDLGGPHEWKVAITLASHA